MLAAFVLIPAIATAGEATSAAEGGQCDGRQMYNYVDVALRAGSGVLNVSKDPAYGGSARSLALKSQNMGIYNAMIVDIREHDLSLARSGCTSLSNGPTKGMMSTLRQVESKIRVLVDGQYSERGVITSSFGEIK
jgi:hypothetical protein